MFHCLDGYRLAAIEHRFAKPNTSDAERIVADLDRRRAPTTGAREPVSSTV